MSFNDQNLSFEDQFDVTNLCKTKSMFQNLPWTKFRVTLKFTIPNKNRKNQLYNVLIVSRIKCMAFKPKIIIKIIFVIYVYFQ